MAPISRRRIEYGALVEDALRTVVRDVLGRFMRGEVPPPHHFFITFRTGARGVDIADHLRERYPAEMTIVLQHQFWDLEVSDDRLAVTLSFNDIPERLVIPFRAIKVFADPGVNFGLQFTLDDAEAAADAPVSTLPRAKPAEPLPALVKAPDPATDPDKPDDDGAGGAEIVTLDRFRKK
ncbi:MAG: hypothetical protein KDG89_05200 [Geminicoccaceae bacterium]|nr:hypothetical protein [Geminicoccaceae bacterium]